MIRANPCVSMIFPAWCFITVWLEVLNVYKYWQFPIFVGSRIIFNHSLGCVSFLCFFFLNGLGSHGKKITIKPPFRENISLSIFSIRIMAKTSNLRKGQERVWIFTFTFTKRYAQKKNINTTKDRVDLHHWHLGYALLHPPKFNSFGTPSKNDGWKEEDPWLFWGRYITFQGPNVLQLQVGHVERFHLKFEIVYETFHPCGHVWISLDFETPKFTNSSWSNSQGDHFHHTHDGFP